jgi:hypothetical protein
MTSHEKDLLIIMFGMLFFISFGGITASQTIDTPILLVLSSSIISFGGKMVVFVFLGLGSMVYEIRNVSHDMRKTTSFNKGKTSISPEAIGSSIGIVILGIILGLPAYIWGSDAAILDNAYIFINGGFGFSLIVGMMFTGAVIARLQIYKK